MTKQQINEDAYRRLKPEIDSTFEEGWFIAIDDGKIIADAASYEDLEAKLDAMGDTHAEALVVQAGEDYLESATIFL